MSSILFGDTMVNKIGLRGLGFKGLGFRGLGLFGDTMVPNIG